MSQREDWYGLLNVRYEFTPVNPLRPRQMDDILQTTYSHLLSCMKSIIILFTECCCKWSNCQYASSGSEKGLATIKRQIIMWTNGGLVYRRIYAALGLDEFRNDTAKSDVLFPAILSQLKRGKISQNYSGIGNGCRVHGTVINCLSITILEIYPYVNDLQKYPYI